MESGAQQGTRPLITAIQQGRWHSVEALIAAGADVNETNDKGATALMVAAEKGDIISLNVLIHAGASLNAKDNEGRTALQVARGSCDIALKAAGAGSDVSAKGTTSDKAPPQTRTASSPTPALPLVNRAPSELSERIMRVVSQGRQGRSDLRRLIERCKDYDDGLSILEMARRSAGHPLTMDLDAAIKAWHPPRTPASSRSQADGAAPTTAAQRLSTQIPSDLRTEIMRFVNHGYLDSSRLKHLIESCKAYDDARAVLSEARRACKFGSPKITKTLLAEAIRACRPPPTPERRWWQFWTAKPSKAGRYVPSTLKAEIMKAATLGAGDGDYRKALIERCKAYDDGLSTLSEARRVCNSYRHQSAVSLFADKLDEAITAWQPPRAPEPVRKREDKSPSQAQRPASWPKGQPNPVSKSVIRIFPFVRFLCPTCSTPNNVIINDIPDVSGVLVKCDGCGDVSHVPAAYKTQADVSGLAVHGSIRVPIAEFNDWMLAHPSFLTSDAHVHPDVEFHGNYGLWGICAGCHYQYASTVVAASYAWGGDLFEGATVMFNAHSEKSALDFEALSKKECPSCGNPDLLAIMVDVPQYVRDAVNAEKKNRGL